MKDEHGEKNENEQINSPEPEPLHGRDAPVERLGRHQVRPRVRVCPTVRPFADLPAEVKSGQVRSALVSGKGSAGQGRPSQVVIALIHPDICAAATPGLRVRKLSTKSSLAARAHRHLREQLAWGTTVLRRGEGAARDPATTLSTVPRQMDGGGAGPSWGGGRGRGGDAGRGGGHVEGSGGSFIRRRGFIDQTA